VTENCGFKLYVPISSGLGRSCNAAELGLKFLLDFIEGGHKFMEGCYTHIVGRKLVLRSYSRLL
jgi:hypothetical protein